MAKKGLANRKLKSTLTVVGIVMLTLLVSVVTYYYQEGQVVETSVIIKIEEVDHSEVFVRNIGTATATNLESIPPAFFDPPSIEPGEKTRGRFSMALTGYTIVTVSSDNGGLAVKKFGDSPDSES